MLMFAKTFKCLYIFEWLHKDTGFYFIVQTLPNRIRLYQVKPSWSIEAKKKQYLAMIGKI